MNFKLTQKATKPPKAHKVASMRAGRRAGTPLRSGSGRGQGGGDRKKNLPSKEELDTCIIVNKEYSKEEYARLTATEKLKLWMIRNPGKTPSTGAACQSRGASIASISSTGTNCAADASHEGDIADIDNPWGGDRSRNREDKAIAARQHAKLQKIDTD